MSGEVRFPWDSEPAPAAAVDPDPDAPAPRPKPRGRRPAAMTRAPAAGTGPDWLYHHLTLSGPADSVDAFATAARGAGVTPWHLDPAQVEADVFALALSQLGRGNKLTVAGCRILARQFRERVDMRQAKAAALVGQSQACPFDLHALLPVPEAILMRGPTDPEALAWLAAHWGVTDRLRQVTRRDGATTGRRLKRGHAVISYGFFTHGETPRAAIAELAARWPALKLRLVPRPSP